MKRALLVILTIMCILETKAQYVGSSEIPLDKFTILDSAQMKFTYNFRYIRSWSENDSDTTKLEDNQSLLIGEKGSKYYSDYYFDYCENEMKRKRNDMIYVYIPKEYGACSFEIFKNFSENKMTVTEQAGINILGGHFIYIEDTPSMQWKIESDTTTILTYSCQKATTTFRGRNYTAWFASDIPLNNGPWKFGGLPGLILKISDESKRYMFECIGIKQLNKPEPVKFYNIKYTTLKRLELDKIYTRYFKDLI